MNILKWFSASQRKIFGLLLCVCTVLVLLQYRVNFSSTLYCGINVARNVQARTIEYHDKNLTETSRIIQSSEAENHVVAKACEPKKYVLFLKTHKTGSSTITNILNRYADKNNMCILLPKGDAYYSFDWPNKFRLSFAVDTFKRPNFLANHARYSRKSMNVVFPRSSTTYISVLRHPIAQWESTFQYMSFPYILGITDKEDPLDFFLNNLPAPENVVEVARHFPSLYLIRNPLFFDLGLDHRHYDNATLIRRALKTLDDDFEMVLIMEHFDESLTLLRRRLCWDIDDVVYFKMNERLNKHKRRKLTPSQVDKIKRWNNADMALYDHFVEKFWRQVNNEGPDFYDDVIELRRRRKYYSNLCIEREAVEEAYSSVFVKGYKMRSNLTGTERTFCERMLKNELHYMDYFRSQRSSMINRIEGLTIENFERATEELNVPIKSENIEISDYLYGRPEWKRKKKERERLERKLNPVLNSLEYYKKQTWGRKNSANDRKRERALEEADASGDYKKSTAEIRYVMSDSNDGEERALVKEESSDPVKYRKPKSNVRNSDKLNQKKRKRVSSEAERQRSDVSEIRREKSDMTEINPEKSVLSERNLEKSDVSKRNREKSDMVDYKKLDAADYRKRRLARSKLKRAKKKATKTIVDELAPTTSAPFSEDISSVNNDNVDAKYDGKTIMTSTSDIELV